MHNWYQKKDTEKKLLKIIINIFEFYGKNG